MKKMFSLVLALMAVLILSVPAFAKEVTVDDYKLTMELPEDWLVITKESTEDEEIFVEYFYYEPMMEYLEEGGYSILALDAEGTFEFNLILEQTDDYVPLKDLSSFALNTNRKDAEKEWKSYGYENVVTDTYEGTVETFITVTYDYVIDGDKVYGLDYVGFVDGIYCIFSIYSYDGIITEEDISDMNGIVDSIVSENIIPESVQTSSSSSSSSGARFFVRHIKSIFAFIVAAVGGAFAWIKRKLGKNKAQSEETITTETQPPVQNFVEENFEETEYIESGEYHAEAPAENVGEAPEYDEKRCPECGGAVAEDDKFCPLCGKKL